MGEERKKTYPSGSEGVAVDDQKETLAEKTEDRRGTGESGWRGRKPHQFEGSTHGTPGHSLDVGSLGGSGPLESVLGMICPSKEADIILTF